MSEEVIKRLGATTTVLNTDTALYTVPANTFTAVSTINVCNCEAAAATFRIAHVDGAIGTVQFEDYIAYDENIQPSGTSTYNIKMAMEAADTILVRSSSVTVAFQAWGAEVS